MSYYPERFRRLPVLEELEPRQLLAGLTPIPAVPLSNPAPAIVSPAQTQQPVTGPKIGAGNPVASSPAAAVAQGANGQTGQTPSANQTPATANPTGTTPAQAFAAGNQSAFVTTTPAGALPGFPTPGTGNGQVSQPSLSINPAANLSQSVVGRNPTLAYNTLQQQSPYADPFGIRLVGGSRPLVDQNPPYNPRLGESEPETEGTLPIPAGPVEGAPGTRPPELSVPPPPANPAGQPDDLSSETPARPASAVDDLFASLPQTSQDLVPGLDELALLPGVLEAALASSLGGPEVL